MIYEYFLFNIIEILSNISYDWSKIVPRAAIYTSDFPKKLIFERNLTWKNIPLYPSCQYIELEDFIENHKNMMQIYIVVEKVNFQYGNSYTKYSVIHCFRSIQQEHICLLKKRTKQSQREPKIMIFWPILDLI